jgi:hypothetical protein
VVQQPQGVTVLEGDEAGFTVAVTGSEPLSFQWRKDGVPMTGANAQSLALTNVQTNDAGYYSVVVTNAAGGLESAGALLSVELPQPLRFLSAEQLPQGMVRLRLTGAPMQNAVVQGSSDFSNWQPLFTNASSTGVWEIIDVSATNTSRRFYRAVR